MPRAIGYVRVSSSGQEARGAGLAAQERAIREYADGEGLRLLTIVRETASGAVQEGELTSAEHRPALSQLLEQAERGEYDTLIVATFDRLSRDQIDGAFLKRWFAKYGVR